MRCADMKKRMIAIALAFTLAFGFTIPAFAASVTDFTDVPAGSWYYDAVDYAASNGLFSGTSSTMFSPGVAMTRGMFVTVLGRLDGVPDSYGRTKTTPFNDVTQADYFFPYTAWANDNGVVSGLGDGSFNPNGEITREQIAAILFRYAEKSGYELTYSGDKYNAFTDTNRVSSYAVTALQWATTHGIINGDGGKLSPKENATRAQVAQIFLNFTQLKSGSPSEPEEPETPDWENYNPTYDIPTGKSAVDADGGYYDYDLANEIMAQINALRVENGLDALLYHPQIQVWAGIRAKEHTTIHNNIGNAHTRPDGSNCLTVGQGLCFENLLWSEGYNERIADCSKYAAELVIAWYNSTSHRQSMLSSAPNLGAISCYVKGNNVYICHLFSMKTLYYMDYLIQ